MTTRNKLALAAALVAFATATFAPHAQAQAFPAKPVRWVVGYPAGGGTDFLARTAGAQLSQQLGQPVLVDNRPGAGAIIASENVARSPGDGYTVFSADNYPHLIERIRMRKPGGMTAFYDALAVYLRGASAQDGQKVLVAYTDGGDTRSTINAGDVAKGVKKAMEKAKDKDKVNVLVQVKTGDQTRFVALSLKKAKV